MIKTLLAGCGARALLSVVGCVGLVGVGTYAVDQELREEFGDNYAETIERDLEQMDREMQSGDPFGSYEGGSWSERQEREESGWGDETQ